MMNLVVQGVLSSCRNKSHNRLDKTHKVMVKEKEAATKGKEKETGITINKEGAKGTHAASVC